MNKELNRVLMNELRQATHAYKYEIRLPMPIGDHGRKYTGTVQVGREYTDQEVFELAMKMSNGIITKDSELISVKQITID